MLYQPRIYNRSTGDLLFWGFEAQRYLDDPSPEISLDQVLVVQHIKLLLHNPDESKVESAASKRYRCVREEIFALLKKTPFELFQDFLDVVLHEVVRTARLYHLSNPSQIELVLAFPSGWPDSVHREVASIGARAMKKALVTNGLSPENINFAIENVYTVSETLCGVKEWLADTMADEDNSIDFGKAPTNLDELNEGDTFIAADIGGGTGCMTVLTLISKNPLQVDQIGKTQSLEVSGEAVEAEFRSRFQVMISPEDCDGNVNQLVDRICRLFKEEKKSCSPSLGNATWNISDARLRNNPAKGIFRDVIKIDRKLLDRCFDPVIGALIAAIKETLKKRPEVKAIIFLGQFGGSSLYLRKCMAKSTIAAVVQLRHSQTGKMDVVKGALAERLHLSTKFFRKSETVKSYGTLITLPWGKGMEGLRRFPNAVADGAVELEKHSDGKWLKVIEWAIPKGTVFESEKCDINLDEEKSHTWEISDKEIRFEDTIVVSDEVPPPERDGKSYTLWTQAHENNSLFLDGERVDVQQISFSWDLSMSEKLSQDATFLGPYSISDLTLRRIKGRVREGIKHCKYMRVLYYILLWDITEMQVKIYVRATFRTAIGPPAKQLAKQRTITANEKRGGESRSIGLARDIMIMEVIEGVPVPNPNGDPVETHSGLDEEIRPARGFRGPGPPGRLSG